MAVSFKEALGIPATIASPQGTRNPTRAAICVPIPATPVANLESHPVLFREGLKRNGHSLLSMAITLAIAMTVTIAMVVSVAIAMTMVVIMVVIMVVAVGWGHFVIAIVVFNLVALLGTVGHIVVANRLDVGRHVPQIGRTDGRGLAGGRIR
jgi:hypothetical protein